MQYKEKQTFSDICTQILFNTSDIYKNNKINKVKIQYAINYFSDLKKHIADNNLYVDDNGWRNKFDSIINLLEKVRDDEFDNLYIDDLITNIKLYVLHLCNANEKEPLIEYMKNVIYTLDVYFDEYIKFLNFEQDDYEDFYIIYGDLEESLTAIIRLIKQIYIKQDNEKEYKSFKDLEEYVNNFIYLLQHDKFSRSLIPYMNTKNIIGFVGEFINKEE